MLKKNPSPRNCATGMTTSLYLDGNPFDRIISIVSVPYQCLNWKSTCPFLDMSHNPDCFGILGCRWYQLELPKSILTQGHLTKEQLVRLVEWKLKRGKFRPALLGYARKQEDKAVMDVTSRAYEAIKPYCCATEAQAANHEGKAESTSDVPEHVIDEALGILTSLKGIGPATASAIMASMHRSIPFMSDEALMVTCGKREYTAKAYKNLVKALRATCSSLRSQKSDKGIENAMIDWTVADVEMCIFASYQTENEKTRSNSTQKDGTTKRRPKNKKQSENSPRKRRT